VFEIITFVIASLGILYISRTSLRSLDLHGFYRFFAWELILILMLLNIRIWFKNPFAPYQIISWVLLILSIYLVMSGLRLLRIIGQPDVQREDDGLLGLEKTTRLVTVGVYKFIRHPLYSSLLCLAWGAFFKSPSWLEALLAIGASIFLALTAKIEEQENLHFWGDEYRDYMQHTKMFVPYLF
jgi:protein-S-isoprenylcysteine O-methyltransferase Ste14